MPAILFHHVTFTYEGSFTPVFQDLELCLPQGWTAIVGANGLGKSTLLRLAIGELEAQQGEIRRPEGGLLCPQRLDEPPPDLQGLLGLEMTSMEGALSMLRQQLRLDPAWFGRWESLSPGERRRAWLASVLAPSPPLLAVDEPTNHLDAEGRALVLQALRSYRGTGLLVSHDRELLESLCERTLTLEAGRARLWPLRFGAAMAEAAREREARTEARERAQRAMERTRRQITARAEDAARADARDSGRHLDRHDNDGRARLNLARLTGRDARAGQLKRQIESKLARAEAAVEAIGVIPDYRGGISLQGEVARKDALLRLPAGSFPLGDGRRVRHPELLLRPTDRVAVVGPNGVGKSSLLEHLRASLSIPEDRLLWMAQDLPLTRGPELLEELRSLPPERRGRVLALVARLGSRASALLETRQPSPGETRKLLLAMGLEGRPWLVVLDEPTNHLDLPTIQALEEALSELRCALVLVSHDRAFLARLVTRAWSIGRDGELRERSLQPGAS